MENLSGQNLDQKSISPPPQKPSSFGNEMPPLEQPDNRVGDWNRTQQKARNEKKNSPEAKQKSRIATKGSSEEAGAKQKIKAATGGAEDAARNVTGEILRQSWINVITTSGLSFIYINFHYIMAYIGGPFSKYFPKAGREWLAKEIHKMPAPGQVKKDIEENIGAAIAPFELGLAILVNVAVLVAILVIVFIAWFFTVESLGIVERYFLLNSLN